MHKVSTHLVKGLDLLEGRVSSDVVYRLATVRRTNDMIGVLRNTYVASIGVFEVENSGPVVRFVFLEPTRSACRQLSIVVGGVHGKVEAVENKLHASPTSERAMEAPYAF